jgi:hypothetical protein
MPLLSAPITTGALTSFPCPIDLSNDPGPLRPVACGRPVPSILCDDCDAGALTPVPRFSRDCDNAGAVTPVSRFSRDCYDASHVSALVNSFNAVCSWQLLMLFCKLAFVSCMAVCVASAGFALRGALVDGVSTAAHSAGSSAGSALGWSLVQRALPHVWHSTSHSGSFFSMIAGLITSVSQAPVIREAKQQWAVGLLQDFATLNLW